MVSRPHQYWAGSMSLSLHGHAWLCTIERPKLAPVLAPRVGEERSRHNNLALPSGGASRPITDARAARSSVGHRHDGGEGEERF
jgi:hypothetical protein